MTMSRFMFAALAFTCVSASVVPAKEPAFHTEQALLGRGSLDDRPQSGKVIPAERGGDGGVADTLSFGFVDGDGFAVLGETWTFDHGGPDPFEGWETIELHQSYRTFFRHITADIWVNGDADNGSVVTENTVVAPVLSGLGSIWVGAYENEANDLCWEAGLGYGNSWCQRLVGPILEYDGQSTIGISFSYFNDTERDYDYSRAIVQTLPSGRETELWRVDGEVGLAGNHPASPPIGETFASGFDSFESDTQFRLIFQMTSDGSWSDADGEYTTEYGPFGADDVLLENTGPNGEDAVMYDFESGLHGWFAEECPGIGSFEGIADISTYTIEDPCQCELDGNVLEFHDDALDHPRGQHIYSRTPPIDITNDVVPQISGTGQLEILADWWQYSDLPRGVWDNVVYFRPGWEYYPAICPVTGELQWSGRVGASTFLVTGDEPICAQMRDVGTDHGVPPDAEQVRFVYELFVGCLGLCADFGPENNFTPLIDDIQVRFTLVPEAPPIAYGPGTRFTDGFSQSLQLDPNAPGNADVVSNVNGGSLPFVNGDSLYVTGPIPGAGTEYDTRLWFRVNRKGPGESTAGYDAWRERVQQHGGLDAVDSATDIEAGDFATVKMDTFNVGVNPSPFRYHSYYIEEDARFDAGAGEKAEQNEIIADQVLLPGTQVQFFVTSNYASTPDEFFLLPDTVGGFYSEFEILPGWRDDGGILKFPCFLYIDAFNGGAQPVIEGALDALGLELDRYDYLDASSSWKVPLARGTHAGASNGVPLWQLIGYRGILLNTGSLSGSSVMWPEDFTLLSDWLTTVGCGAGQQVRGLYLNGDGIGSILSANAPGFLHGELGAVLQAEAYNAFGPDPDENYCVRIESPSVGAFAYGTTNSQGDYAYNAWGNWCPEVLRFDVLETTGSGVGNRAYVNTQNASETHYAQVVNEVDGSANYRSVVDGVSWHHLSDRDGSPECESDPDQIMSAVANEISAALEWVFGIGQIPALCEVEICDVTDVIDVGYGGTSTRLFQNAPNPFNPYTTLRFSLATSGPVVLSIYDVGGRVVRTLVDGELEVGLHEVVWDGTDDAGTDLSAGVYWSQLQALGFESNKKMIYLKSGP